MGGTIGILFFSKKFENKLCTIIKNGIICKALSVTISAQVLIIPITILNFNTLSLTFFISNLAAMPILGISIILGFSNIFISFISFELAKYLATILNIVLKLLILISGFVSNLPFSQILVVTPSIITVISYYFLVFNWHKINKKVLAIFLILAIIINYIYIEIPKNFKIYFIDVGQGDSTLIVTNTGKTILIDGGPNENTVFEYLLDRKIKNIDFLVISHFDLDHYCGTVKVIENLNVKNIIVAKQDTYPTELLGNIIIASAGDRIEVDEDTYIDILWPQQNSIYEDNNNSIVARVVYNSFSMLLTGDIEQEAEEQLIKQNQMIKSNILKVSHHGSANATGIEFLERVNPQIALIGVGENNAFGHPSSQVINRLESAGTQVFRTDETGEIIITVINEKIKIKTHKFVNSGK